MLRRKPTALTITSEDIQAFEEAHTRHLAYAKYQKTGEDPEGWFTGPDAGDDQDQQIREENNVNAMAMDPNDELKPLPGDKARIVRTREERIVGTGAGGGVGASGARR